MQPTRDLTPDEIEKSLKAGTRASFANGLYIIQAKDTSGKKGYWRFDYVIDGRRKTISAGIYPETSVDQAKHRASEYKQQVELRIDPSEERQKIAKKRDINVRYSHIYDTTLHPTCFASVALRWANRTSAKVTAKTRGNWIGRINNYLIPTLGHMLMDNITEADVADAIDCIINTGALDTARRVANICNHIFNYGISKNFASRNPCLPALDLLPKARKQHFPAITSPAELAPVLCKIYSFSGTFPVACALRLLPMLLVRPGNLRTAEWNEFDLELGLWLIPSEKMKSDQHTKEKDLPHVVPLSKQAIEILRELYAVTGDTGVLFPSNWGKERFLSDGTFNKALRSLGISTKNQLTSHGFRAVARTMIEEELAFDENLIELQLDHTISNRNGRAYNRTELISQRQTLMQSWSDYLTNLRIGQIEFHDPLADFMSITEREKKRTAPGASDASPAEGQSALLQINCEHPIMLPALGAEMPFEAQESYADFRSINMSIHVDRPARTQSPFT